MCLLESQALIAHLHASMRIQDFLSVVKLRVLSHASLPLNLELHAERVGRLYLYKIYRHGIQWELLNTESTLDLDLFPIANFLRDALYLGYCVAKVGAGDVKKGVREQELKSWMKINTKLYPQILDQFARPLIRM